MKTLIANSRARKMQRPELGRFPNQQDTPRKHDEADERVRSFFVLWLLPYVSNLIFLSFSFHMNILRVDDLNARFSGRNPDDTWYGLCEL